MDVSVPVARRIELCAPSVPDPGKVSVRDRERERDAAYVSGGVRGGPTHVADVCSHYLHRACCTCRGR